MDPMTENEKQIARDIFVSGTPCLKCHITGDPAHDAKAIAPNFLLAGERLKPDWTFRWLLDPSQIAPGTAMPTGLFKKDGDHWIVNLPNPPADIANYLLSLPPVVKWRYDWKPAPETREAELYSDFLVAKDWLDGG